MLEVECLLEILSECSKKFDCRKTVEVICSKESLGRLLGCRCGSHSMYGDPRSSSMSSRSMSTKKHVSSGAATHRIAQQSRVAASLPLAVKRSPTCSVCTQPRTQSCPGIRRTGSRDQPMNACGCRTEQQKHNEGVRQGHDLRKDSTCPDSTHPASAGLPAYVKRKHVTSDKRPLSM